MSRQRPLSFNQLLNAADRAEISVTRAYLMPNIPPEAEKLLLQALRELRRVLSRAGRRPEHLRPR